MFYKPYYNLVFKIILQILEYIGLFLPLTFAQISLHPTSLRLIRQSMLAIREEYMQWTCHVISSHENN